MELYTTSFFFADNLINSNLTLTEEGENVREDLQIKHDLGLVKKVLRDGDFKIVFHPWVFDYQKIARKNLRKTGIARENRSQAQITTALLHCRSSMFPIPCF